MLVNEQLAGKTVSTAYGEISFNEKGESNDLKLEEEKALAHVQGFTHVEPKPKAEPKKEAQAKAKSPSKAKAKEDKEEK